MIILKLYENDQQCTHYEIKSSVFCSRLLLMSFAWSSFQKQLVCAVFKGGVLVVAYTHGKREGVCNPLRLCRIDGKRETLQQHHR